MVKSIATYEGQLHCSVQHQPSSSSIVTDAPVDNQGKGQAFSPTDLMGASLGSCILTTLAIVAEREKIDLIGAKAEVDKEMRTQPSRRIDKLVTKITLPASVPVDFRPRLEAAAHRCPVRASLHAEIEVPIEFVYS